MRPEIPQATGHTAGQARPRRRHCAGDAPAPATAAPAQAAAAGSHLQAAAGVAGLERLHLVALQGIQQACHQQHSGV